MMTVQFKLYNLQTRLEKITNQKKKLKRCITVGTVPPINENITRFSNMGNA